MRKSVSLTDKQTLETQLPKQTRSKACLDRFSFKQQQTKQNINKTFNHQATSQLKPNSTKLLSYLQLNGEISKKRKMPANKNR